jgi:hypothetical protein
VPKHRASLAFPLPSGSNRIGGADTRKNPRTPQENGEIPKLKVTLYGPKNGCEGLGFVSGRASRHLAMESVIHPLAKGTDRFR